MLLPTDQEKLLAELERLRSENALLRDQLGLPPETNASAVEKQPEINATDAPAITHRTSTQKKVFFFRDIFKGRDDVYPVRWKGQHGKTGYAPACANEWRPGICEKPRIKCADCSHRKFLPLTDQVIHDHLSGRHTIGIYPLLTDDSCRFLSVDFDGAQWQADTLGFYVSCRETDVPAAIERSRSGNGAHVWIFFSEPVPARLARQLGSALITRTCARQRQLRLDSYDRLFPNQDTMPKGGFGNLIALPLQRLPREQGNSVFIDEQFKPYVDQWAFLASLARLSRNDIERIVATAAKAEGIIGVRASLVDDDTRDDPWTVAPSHKRKEPSIRGPFPQQASVTLSNLVYVEKAGLPQALLNKIIRLAAFQNPEFYKAQAMRLSTYDKPRIIGCAEDFPRHIGLPRGCLDDVTALLKSCGIKPDVADERVVGTVINSTFSGELSPMQQEVVAAILEHDFGILSAPTAFGKTVVAAWTIAQRKTNTLILVHRVQLLKQWRSRLASFLDLPESRIGVISGGKAKPTGQIDIAVIQSLNRKGEIKDLVADYGQVIVDECHHLSAFRFEQVLKAVKAKYVLGLTATPTRRDGHHPIIVMQCGPIRFNVAAETLDRPFDHQVTARYTDIGPSPPTATIQDVYTALIRETERNRMIVSDAQEALGNGRNILLLTERVEHAELLADQLRDSTQNLFVLHGRLPKRDCQTTFDRLAALADTDPRLLVATGRFIGEGFDHATLDTLLLAMPFSWRGTLQQYAGRLHRHHHAKRIVRIYDYVDANIPVLARMFEKRRKGYIAMGYSFVAADSDTSNTPL